MFNKKKVSKLTFHLVTISYHCLCLSGLIWQITQISINFFKFDVIKDINVVMSDELWKMSRVTYICFPNHNIFDEKKYSDSFDRRSKFDRRISRLSMFKMDDGSKQMFSKYSKIEERFAISPQVSDIYSIRDLSDTDEFIVGYSF